MGKCNLWGFVKPDQCQRNNDLAEKGVCYCLIRKIKNIVVIIVTLGIPGYLLYNQFNERIDQTLSHVLIVYNCWVVQMFLGILLYIILAWLVHFIAFKAISNKKRPECTYMWFFYFLLSPDFYFAKMYKTDLEKNYKRKFIQCSNWLNITITILLCIIVFIYRTEVPIFVMLFFVYRLISRCAEITYAFYNDIVDDREKTSSITRSERISLAIHSFFEVIILYGFIYYLFFEIGPSGDNQFISSLIYSITVSTFNFQFRECDELVFKYVVLTQVIVSLNLVVLSLASYLGSKDCEKKCE